MSNLNVINKINNILSNKDKVKIFGIFILILLSSVLELLGISILLPFLGVILDSGQGDRYPLIGELYNVFSIKTPIGRILFISTLVIFIYLIKNIFMYCKNLILYKFVYNNQIKLGNDLFSYYLNKPLSFHVNTNRADLLRNIGSCCNQVYTVILNILQLGTEIVCCLVLCIYLLFMNWRITCSVIGFLLLFLLIFFYGYKKYSRRLGEECQVYVKNVSKEMLQAFGSIKELKILGREEFFTKRFSKIFWKSGNSVRKNQMAALLPQYVIEVVSIVGIIAIMFSQILSGKEVEEFLPQLIVFVTVIIRLMPSATRLSSYMNAIIFNSPAVDIIYDDIKKMQEIKREKKERIKIFESVKFRDLRVENLLFSYGNKEIIKNVNLDIKSGEVIGLIGESGSGKTTLIDLLIGVQKPQKGIIKVDDIDIWNDILGWQKKIGYIPQNIFLLDDSIKNNIAFGVKEEEIDDDQIYRVLKMSSLLKFVEELPDGIDTIIGESGSRLSGGQRQRIGIARALYNNPDIIVLDEATSALDLDTEREIMNTIYNLKEEKTIIIVAHRLTTIRGCNHVYKVEDGNLLEVTGTI